jgi:2-polyprenyl-3-methyl-5-hydroxy-6-metoxy-1,4-benzoquinol methylase
MRCLLCQSPENETFEKVESFGFPLTYYRCRNCGLVYQSPEESQAGDPAFYAETYRKVYQDTPEPTQKDIWVQSQRAAHLLDLIPPRLRFAPKRVLDVGASAGLLLETFRSGFDCAVTGVEPGDAYRAFAAQKGIPMFPSIEALIENQPGRFDLVSLIHVLEHLADPVGTLEILRRELVSDSGLLLVEVPNLYAHDSYELAHLACYTPQTLKMTLQRAGFRILAFKAHGVPRSQLLPLYLTLVAQPLPEAESIPSLRKERRVGIKRNVSMLYRRLVQKIFPHRAWLPLPADQ